MKGKGEDGMGVWGVESGCCGIGLACQGSCARVYWYPRSRIDSKAQVSWADVHVTCRPGCQRGQRRVCQMKVARYDAAMDVGICTICFAIPPFSCACSRLACFAPGCGGLTPHSGCGGLTPHFGQVSRCTRD